MIRRGFMAILSSAVLLFPGCATNKKPGDSPAQAGTDYQILRDNTPFFRYGPLQPGGPDARLAASERVTLLRRELGYSLVQLSDLRTGYVANEELAVAPPLPSPTPDPAIQLDRQYLAPVPIIDDSRLPDIGLPAPDFSLMPEDAPSPSPSPAATASPTPPNFR